MDSVATSIFFLHMWRKYQIYCNVVHQEKKTTVLFIGRGGGFARSAGPDLIQTGLKDKRPYMSACCKMRLGQNF